MATTVLSVRERPGLLARMKMASAYVFPKLGAFLGGAGYDAATVGRRLHGWTPTTADINTLVGESLNLA